MKAEDFFPRRFAGRKVAVLDGAMGTALEARGLRCELPLWSTWALLDSPEAVLEVHRAAARAGADWLTANTFRTQARTLAAVGMADRAGELTRQAVSLARRAANETAEEASRPLFVVGSQPPLEDCYRPDLVPGNGPLEAEHRAHARHLAEAGVDLILAETLNCVREAVAAAEAVLRVERPCWVSFVVDEHARLLSGEPLEAAIRAVSAFDPLGVGVNCLATSALPESLAVLRACGRDFSVHPNLGPPLPGGGFREALSAGDFAREATVWLEAGARVVGGCCGTTADHVGAVVTEITETPS
ncbi:MAG: homocysteine S-methyltransferase family protein [Myxococcota bacterium]|nr:homocysteine S-methyltransferase family protein [Myxococcota bacterium]